MGGDRSGGQRAGNPRPFAGSVFPFLEGVAGNSRNLADKSPQLLPQISGGIPNEQRPTWKIIDGRQGFFV